MDGIGGQEGDRRVTGGGNVGGTALFSPENSLRRVRWTASHASKWMMECRREC